MKPCCRATLTRHRSKHCAPMTESTSNPAVALHELCNPKQCIRQREREDSSPRRLTKSNVSAGKEHGHTIKVNHNCEETMEISGKKDNSKADNLKSVNN